MSKKEPRAFGFNLDEEGGRKSLEILILKETAATGHGEGPDVGFMQQISMLGETYRAYGHALIEEAAGGYVLAEAELVTLERIEYLYMLGTSSTQSVRAFRTANLQQGKDLFSGIGPSLSESVRKLSGLSSPEKFHISTDHGIGRSQH